MAEDPENWRVQNRKNWDRRAALHVGDHEIYRVDTLRDGTATLDAIEAGELGPVEGLRILHLQCHFGRDSLILAKQGADVTGLDFSSKAIGIGRALAKELGLAGRARFVEADLYEAPDAIDGAGSFDLVFVTWGALCWLPDIRGWAQIVAHFLKPRGALYLADHHPVAFVFDDAGEGGREGRTPGWFWPYFQSGALREDNPLDYVGDMPELGEGPEYSWCHPLGSVVTALIDSGLTLRWLHEHDSLPWRAFDLLVKGDDGLWRWPDSPWLPLSYSLRATKG